MQPTRNASSRLVCALITLSLLIPLGCGSGAEDGEPDTGADGEQSACDLGTLPSTYDSPGWATNAAVEVDLRTRFKAFLQAMKDAEADLANKPTEEQLTTLFGDGTPSVRSIATSYYADKVDTWITAFAAAAGNGWSPSPTPTGPGGKYGKYIFNAEGTDLRQAIEKGLFGAALYNHALSLMDGAVTDVTVDRLIAIYGANPTFPQDDKAETNPDEFVAVYAKRRDDKASETPGPYRRIRSAFIEARAAAAAGASCRGELDAALATLRTEWERVVFSTVIYYLNDAATKLSVAAPTDDDYAGGLHGYGEAVGFLHGWRGVRADRRTITDADIDELLTLIGAPPSGPATSYRLLTDTAAELPKVTEAISEVATIYGFTAPEVEAFKVNY